MGKYSGLDLEYCQVSSNVSSLQVQFTPCYPETAGQQKTFYIGGGYNIYRWVMRRAMPAFLISMMVILIGLYISIYWIVIRCGSRIDGTLLYLGIFQSWWEHGRPMRRMWQRCSWPTGRDALIWHLLRSCCCRCPLSCL